MKLVKAIKEGRIVIQKPGEATEPKPEALYLLWKEEEEGDIKKRKVRVLHSCEAHRWIVIVSSSSSSLPPSFQALAPDADMLSHMVGRGRCTSRRPRSRCRVTPSRTTHRRSTF
jgi:hypothetical protein